MSTFHDYLRQQIRHGPLATEDVLVALLPLMKQVITAHDYGDVAPLEGLDRLHVDAGRIWFAEADQRPQRRNARAVRRMLLAAGGALDVVRERRIEFNVDAGIVSEESTDADAGKPAYSPGYVCWEHTVEHHDPTTDVFSLGLILASLACGLDLAEHDSHQRFVDNRSNLFRINPDLHPVVARTITLMTDLDRHRRPQDLKALLSTLENYRDQEVDFETDLASDLHPEATSRPGRRQVILSKLQQRLFEINRRNRLLQFRATMQTVNLTQASIPVAFDFQRIRQDQVLTWNGKFRDGLLKQKPVSLNAFLNFREAIYLPGTLDRIRAEARRDETEYGFAQLRLIIAFLRWSDLKTKPAEQYESPLLLLPVKLDVKKGIHDRYTLTASDNRAEVNPVVRHLCRQLYDIDLPDSVEPSEAGISGFLSDLKSKIHASDTSVELTRVDKPRIELIHEKARRRLDQFVKRARLAGRGIRHFMDLDYSYDPVNYHPLGVRLFEHFIKPAKTHLEQVVTTKPPKRRFAVQPADADDQGANSRRDGKQPLREGKTPAEPRKREREASAEPPTREGEASAEPRAPEAVVETDKQFYAFAAADENPFNWEFDLCSVTLANLKYRRMSLVRDYAQLATDNTPNAAFEAAFSITPVNRAAEHSQPVPVDDRFHVVPCDPTQLQAVRQARGGSSYIIQGPPGTGKSQTITNLIADYVVRGRRVLFVCEKRAAIDVVFHRLKQQGLHELCCLIHDSQADKKQFVMDLKQTYDAFMAEAGRSRDHFSNRRRKIVERVQAGLQPLADFTSAMQAPLPGDGVSGRASENAMEQPTAREGRRTSATLRSVLDRLVELRGNVPNLVPREWERVPAYREWLRHEGSLADFSSRLKQVQSDGVLAHHPLCLLSADVADAEHPIGLVTECVAESVRLLEVLIAQLDALALPGEICTSVDQLDAAVAYAAKADFLAERDLLPLLDPKSEPSKLYAKRLRRLQRCDKALDTAREATFFWKRRLSSEDTRVALQQARQFEGSLLSVLKPSWWRLRRILNDAYDFSRHVVKPSWVQVLQHLDTEHDKRAARYTVANEIGDEFSIHLDFDRFHEQLTQLRDELNHQPGPIKSLNRHALKNADGCSTLRKLAALRPTLDELCLTLDRCLDGFRHRSLPELRDDLNRMHSALDQLPGFLNCLASLKSLPHKLTAAIRSLPLTLTELEAACAEQSLRTAYRDDQQLAGFDGHVRETHLAQLAEVCDQWQDINAKCLREQVRQKFTEHVELASRSASQLSDEEKEFKKLYTRGRREIEHEFGKSMRYKAIRELAAGDSGVVIRDLKPVWLMSPLSVSDTLPLSSEMFDVVIFDEASQITLEEAIPSLFRAEQTIVVGDEMQLPPTSFFSSRKSGDDDDDDLSFEEEGEVVQYDLNSSSFLNHAARNLPSRMLGWHYRSRSESLISFSNHAFYGGRLLTVPDERLGSEVRPELIATSPEDAVTHATELTQRPVSFHFLQNAVYEKRTNAAEAEYIARLVRQLLTTGRDDEAAARSSGVADASSSGTHYSIGVVAFSEAQQDEIDRAIRRLADDDANFAELLEKELEREEDGQFMGLLVKNLENIQGDERDIIIMSVCYGPDAKGKVRMNFGPINQSGGEKRLNVAFSRAKHCMVLVSSLRSSDITNDYNDGANCLKNYLRYAEACSIGRAESVSSILKGLSGRDEHTIDADAGSEPVIDDIAAELTRRGFRVDVNVGQSHFRCDLAVYKPGDSAYRLGILVDGQRWYSQTDLLERELQRPALLRAFGWNVRVVLARDWYSNRDAVMEELLATCQS